MTAERPTKEQIESAAQKSTFLWAASVMPRVVHPILGNVPMRPYQYQASFWRDASQFRVVLKSRQAGISQAIAIEALHTAIYKPGATILIVSRNLEAATNVLGYARIAAETNSVNMPRISNDRSTYLTFGNGSRILSVAATRSAGRTYAATSVYLDEFAWMPWALDIYQAVSPTTSHGGRLTVISTPNGRANPFFLLWQGELGESFSRHTIPWYRVPPYNDSGWMLKTDAESLDVGEGSSWYKTTRPRYTAQQWASEYGVSFVDSGQTVFCPSNIERASDIACGLLPPDVRRDYVTFWDIGRRSDATVGSTLDVTNRPFQLVAWERGEGWSYPHIQDRIAQRYIEYPGRHYVESNGIGDPVIENSDVPVQPWTTTARSKEQMITALQLLLENGEIGIPEIAQLRLELLLYQWNDKDIVQDCVMSLAGASAIANGPRYISGYAGTI